jgi:hypothetical protein
MSHEFSGEKLVIKEVADHATQHENGGSDELDLSELEGTEIRLVPIVASSGPEGTIFYCSTDDHVYVGTEV